jgi:hypothetical protein
MAYSQFIKKFVDGKHTLVPVLNDGQGFRLLNNKGWKETIAELPIPPGDNNDCYFVGATVPYSLVFFDPQSQLWTDAGPITEGAPGTPGALGPQGPQGMPGVPGAPGTPGANGLSAYQIALANGFAGTEEQWLASLVGPEGPGGASNIPISMLETEFTVKVASGSAPNYFVRIDSVINSSMARDLFNIGDTLVLNAAVSLTYAVTSVSAEGSEIVLGLQSQEAPVPPTNARLYLKNEYGVIPLGTNTMPGLVTRRARNYMETPNEARTDNASTLWIIDDVDDVLSEDVFHLGDWVMINGEEFLIQSVVIAPTSITIATSPAAPLGAAGPFTVYHYIEQGVIPLATATTPGLVRRAVNRARRRQIDLYVQGNITTQPEALLTLSRDYATWMVEPCRLISLAARTVEGSCNIKIKTSDSGIWGTPDGWETEEFEVVSNEWRGPRVIKDTEVLREGMDIEVSSSDTGGNAKDIRIIIVGEIIETEV